MSTKTQQLQHNRSLAINDARGYELTATGAIPAGAGSIGLNHATVIIASTIADAKNHQGLVIFKDTSTAGTAAHKVTITTGTFDGTNKIATFNAPNDALVVLFDGLGNGTIVANVGVVIS